MSGILESEVVKPEMLQGWILIDRTINLVIKNRDNSYKFLEEKI